MKINIFSVPDGNVSALKAKFDQVGLKAIHTATDGTWETVFYFSAEQTPAEIPWVSTFSEFFGDLQPENLIYFGSYVFERPSRCYVLTYGKAHFYVRPFCDHDFGIEVAKRIADEDDIKQKASKRFAGRRKKEIGSYTSNTRLDIESGESVDYLRAGILDSWRKDFGRTAKFGSSVLFNASIDKSGIGQLLDKVTVALASPPTFALPRTAEITDAAEVARYDAILLDAIVSDDRSTDFAHAGHEIVGVDFVFSGNEEYTLTATHHRPRILGEADLDLGALRSYIKDEAIGRDEILGIRIKVDNEGQRAYSKTLKDSLDYIVDSENVMLSQGRWLRFNEDYVDQLNNSVDGIAIEPTEPELEEISTGEPAFNDSSDVAALGYMKADKDFSKIKTRASTPIEAWDLRRGDTVYAVKFATAQKLGYVCDQANAVLEIIRNNANVKKLDPGWRAYCLWLGFKTVTIPARMSEVNSIILKQKMDAWARGCRNLGIEPKLKFSRRVSGSP
jgi:uncharacterized protein (TIGR04141 family)